MSASGTVAFWPWQVDINDAPGLGPDTIDFPFRFLAESPALLSVAHTVSAEYYVTFSLLLVSAESKTSAFSRPLPPDSPLRFLNTPLTNSLFWSFSRLDWSLKVILLEPIWWYVFMGPMPTLLSKQRKMKREYVMVTTAIPNSVCHDADFMWRVNSWEIRTICKNKRYYFYKYMQWHEETSTEYTDQQGQHLSTLAVIHLWWQPFSLSYTASNWKLKQNISIRNNTKFPPRHAKYNTHLSHVYVPELQLTFLVYLLMMHHLIRQFGLFPSTAKPRYTSHFQLHVYWSL